MTVNDRKFEIIDLAASSVVRWSNVMFVKADSGGTELDDTVNITISCVSADTPSGKLTVTFTRRELNAIIRTLENLS